MKKVTFHSNVIVDEGTISKCGRLLSSTLLAFIIEHIAPNTLVRGTGGQAPGKGIENIAPDTLVRLGLVRLV